MNRTPPSNMLLALQVAGMPGRLNGQHRRSPAPSQGGQSPITSAAPSASPSKVETTSTTTTSLLPIQQTDKTVLCGADGFTWENWIKYDMDHLMDFMSTNYPHGIDDKDVSQGTDWVTYLADNTGSLGNIDCEVASGVCDLGSLSDETECSANKYWTPMLFFALYAAENLFAWAEGVKSSLQEQSDTFQTQVMGIVEDFLPTDVSGDTATGIMTMIGGVLGGVAAMLGPFAPVSATVVGAVAGIEGFANGAQFAAANNAAQNIQNELNAYSSLEDVVGNTVVLLQNATMMIVENALNIAPDNSESDTGNTWNQWPTSAPYLMRNGSMAEPFKDIYYNVLSGEFTKYVNSSAITAALIAGDTFIASRSDDVSGEHPCDISLKYLDGARVCSADGSTAYFFMKSQNWASWGDYVAPKGLTSVGNYGCNLTEMAYSAVWISSKYQPTDGYMPQLTPSDIFGDITGSDPAPGGLFVNLPVFNADGLPTPDLYEMGGESGSAEQVLMLEIIGGLPAVTDWAYPDSVVAAS